VNAAGPRREIEDGSFPILSAAIRRAVKEAGFHDVYDKNQERGIHVWVEDYDLNADEAIDKINEKRE
jgi:phosphoribosylformylglycinamidine (FGAM) synthase PurS component